MDVLFRALLERAARRHDGRAPELRAWLDLAEAWRIVHALRESRGNRSAAARALGIGRRTLYTKMEKLGIAEDWAAPALHRSGGPGRHGSEREEARHPAVPRLLGSDPVGG